MMCFSVSASDVNALAFSSTGYDGDEVQIFSPPDSGTLSVFTLEDSGWYFYGLNSITGMRVKNDIPYVFAVVGKPDPTDEPDTKYKTELMIDLSGDGYDLTRFSTMYFGIAIVGDNDIKYTVSASLYSGGGRIDCETLVGVGWNLYAMDIRSMTGSASHLKITVYYDTEIPANIRVSAPYVTENLNSGFAMVDKYLTNSLDAAEGLCVQKSGRIKPDDSTGRAVLNANLMLIDDTLENCAGENLYFEFGIGGVNSGGFTLSLRSFDGSELAQSKKISLYSGVTSFTVPLKVSEEPASYTLTFDNIDCDVYFTLEYVKVRRFSTSPAKAEAGIGQLTRITKSSSGVTFTGGMERAAVAQYSRSSDGMIHFYSLPAERMDDLSYANELGSIKLSTVFEYTAQVEDTEGMMFFAGVSAADGTILPLSHPRFPDAESAPYPTESAAIIGLYDPASVGAFESNISAVMTEVRLEDIIVGSASKNTYSVPYKSSAPDEEEQITLEFDRQKLSELDSDIEFYTTAGVRVYIRLSSSSADTSLISAAVRFLSSRYPSVMGFAVGDGINLPSTMAAFGTSRVGDNNIYSLEEYVSDLALFYRSIYDAASSSGSGTLSGSSKVVIVPVADSDEITLGTVPLSTMLVSRLAEIGKIPLLVMSDYDISAETHSAEAFAAVQMISELECGEIDGLVYFCAPSTEDIEAKYSSEQETGSFTEYAARLFVSTASSLAGGRTRCIFFSLDNTNLKNSRDFYSVLKQSDEATGHVYDYAAIMHDSTTDDGAKYSLCDFTDKYYSDGWIAGGGVESCITTQKNGESSRVLTVSFKHDAYNTYRTGSSGSAGITLRNFDKSVDFTNVSSLEFTFSLSSESSSAPSSVVFVIGNDETRAEYYAEGLECGTEYKLSCPLGGFETRGRVGYIGIMVYSDVNVMLELSSVDVCSSVLDEGELAALFTEKENTHISVDYKTIAFFSFTIAAVSIIVFVFLSKLEKEDEENDAKHQTTGGRNEQKFRRG